MNILLCGLPTCGKTTIGKKVAEHLQWNFIDTDHLVEKAYGISCCQIAKEKGEEVFRRLEKEQITSLLGCRQSVIALGGGSINQKTEEIIVKMGCIIYLKASVAVLWERLSKRGMLSILDPMNPEESFYKLAKTRIPLYEKMAHFIIDTTGLSEQEVLQEILKDHGK